jgi:L-amino acid N-acyltransferase YncA
MDIHIEALTKNDWDDVRSIYLEGIAIGEATLETDPPSFEEWDSSHLSSCRIIVRRGSQIVGWAALSPVSSRRVYRGVAEVSIYIAASCRGEGIGKALLDALIEASETAGIWTLESSMFPENESSIRLHKSCSFREVGFRERIGELDGKWRNTILMERRSKVVGGGALASDKTNE